MEGILSFLKGRLEQINWLGILFLALGAVLVYASQPIGKLLINKEEKRKVAELVSKIIGLACAVLAMLLLMDKI